MQLDAVHDIQHVYRKMVDSMSRPGTIASIKEQAQLARIRTKADGAVLLLAMTLLDTEVTFHVESPSGTAISERINELTYAKAVPAAEADYIFVLKDAGELALERMIEAAKPGYHLNPHQSATIIAEADALGSGTELLLKGPGIEHSRLIALELKGNWVGAREEKNAEFPLGVDLIITDSESLLCLPRTTQITTGEDH